LQCWTQYFALLGEQLLGLLGALLDSAGLGRRTHKTALDKAQQQRRASSRVDLTKHGLHSIHQHGCFFFGAKSRSPVQLSSHVCL
jgi:hypothetical protein